MRPLTELGPWYQSLRKPSWQPPDWLFGPAWTLIFALAAVAGVLAWTQRARSCQPYADIGGYSPSMRWLNVLWSELFFGFQRPDWALVEVGLLWFSIVLLMVVLARHSKAASWLLAPYLAWVSFAALLNLAVVRLNYPFHATP